MRQLSSRSGGLSSEEVFGFNYPIKFLTTFVSPGVYGLPKDGTYPNQQGLGIYWEDIAFMGIIPIVLFGLALSKTKRKNWEWSFIVLAILSLLFVLGKNTPFSSVLTIPPFNNFRLPSRYLLLTTFAISGLSASGFELLGSYLKRMFKDKKIIDLILMLIMLVAFLNLASFTFSYHELTDKDKALKEPEVIDAVTGGRVYDDFSIFPLWKSIYQNNGYQDSDAFIYFKNILNRNSNLVWNASNVLAYAGLYPERLEVVGEIMPYLINESSVSYFISPNQLDLPQFELHNTVNAPRSDLSDLFVYKNLQKLDRFRFVSNYQVVDSISDAEQIIKEGEVDLATTVLLEDSPDGESFQEIEDVSIDVIEDTDQRLVLRTKTDKPALLVIADSYYPAWKAKINDNKADIIPANINQRAVVVPGGNSTVEFYYDKKVFYDGFKISSITALFVVTLYLLERKKLLRLGNL